MKAKDTVMSTEQIGSIMQPCVSPTAQGVFLAQKQAEISFKAGINEVVEFLKADYYYDTLNLYIKGWQAKLKEWKISK